MTWPGESLPTPGSPASAGSRPGGSPSSPAPAAGEVPQRTSPALRALSAETVAGGLPSVAGEQPEPAVDRPARERSAPAPQGGDRGAAHAVRPVSGAPDPPEDAPHSPAAPRWPQIAVAGDNTNHGESAAPRGSTFRRSTTRGPAHEADDVRGPSAAAGSGPAPFGEATGPFGARPAPSGQHTAPAPRSGGADAPTARGTEPPAPPRNDPPSPPRVPAQGPGGPQRTAPGTVVGGRYTLRTAIGHGGMGTVWRASDTVLRRDVAVKEVLLPPGLAPSDRDAMYQRTLREARAAAALSHPAVVQVYDVVTDGGRPWIVMELLQSRSLAEMIVEDGPLAPRAVAKIGIALLGALEVAHAAGVLHRDVKPANVLISSDGRCVLTDFGVARMPTDAELTTPGMVLGSPHFISPERAVGAAFGPPSDLFSLGVTLYTAVEGRPPFDKADPFETMRAVVEEAPAPAMRAGALAGVLYGLF